MSKRKADEAAAASSNANAAEDVPRKEKKRKLKEQTRDAASTEDEPKLSKEERREKKRLKKEKKERKEKEKAAEAGTTNDDSDDATPAKPAAELDEKAAKRAAKEARKAEQKRLRALKKAEQEEDDDDEEAEPEPNAVAQTSRQNGASSSSSLAYNQASSLSTLPQSEVDKFLSDNHITINGALRDATLRPILAFSHLPATATPEPKIFAAFKSPTPIQSAAWPFLLAGRDVVGVAETGSGKTLAFGVPCVRHILAAQSGDKTKGSPARAVIVSPTRELAVQIYDQIILISKPAGLGAVCVYGGVPKDGQRKDLKTAQIVVATPGRLNDLIEEGSADLSNVSYVVLDEADRMLDKGFEQEIRKIISSTLPSPSSSAAGSLSAGRNRQTLMFTATWPPSVRELAATFMHNPVRINIGADNPDGELRANNRIKQLVEVVDTRAKEQRLLQLIKQYQSGKQAQDRILVFCLYKKEASRVENFLYHRGMKVAGIHGDLSQERRTKALEGFKSGETPLLVATDVAARGLDIPNVKLVLNVTFPLTIEDYVHRIGRTGRAGADGLAITMFTEHDKAHSGSLIAVLKAANQAVPEELMKFGTTIKKKQHDTYGAFYKEDTGKKAEKIKFDD